MAVGASGLSFDLDAGERPRALVIDTADGPVRLTTPVCFEDAVPSVVRRLVRDTNAGLIVNLSNDGWFGTSDAGRRAHEVAAAFRCIELRRPMIRAANTGCSSVIDMYGNVQSRLAPRTAGTLAATVVSQSAAVTGYSRLGNWFGQLLAVATGAGLVWCVLRRRRKDASCDAS